MMKIKVIKLTCFSKVKRLKKRNHYDVVTIGHYQPSPGVQLQ